MLRGWRMVPALVPLADLEATCTGDEGELVVVVEEEGGASGEFEQLRRLEEELGGSPVWIDGLDYAQGLSNALWVKHSQAGTFTVRLDGFITPDGSAGTNAFTFACHIKKDDGAGRVVLRPRLYTCKVRCAEGEVDASCTCPHFMSFTPKRDGQGRLVVCKHLAFCLDSIADPNPPRLAAPAPPPEELHKTYHGPGQYDADGYAELLQNFHSGQKQQVRCFQSVAEVREWVGSMAPDHSAVWSFDGRRRQVGAKPLPGPVWAENQQGGLLESMTWRCRHAGGKTIEVRCRLEDHANLLSVMLLPGARVFQLVELVCDTNVGRMLNLHPQTHRVQVEGARVDEGAELWHVGIKNGSTVALVRGKAVAGAGRQRAQRQIGSVRCNCQAYFHVENTGKRSGRAGPVRVVGKFAHNPACLQRLRAGSRDMPAWARQQLDRIVGQVPMDSSLAILSGLYQDWALQDVAKHTGQDVRLVAQQVQRGALLLGRAYLPTPEDLKNSKQRVADRQWKLHADHLTSVQMWAAKGKREGWLLHFQDQAEETNVSMSIMTQRQVDWLVGEGQERDLQLDATCNSTDYNFNLTTLLLKPAKDVPGVPVAFLLHAEATTAVLQIFLDKVASKADQALAQMPGPGGQPSSFQPRSVIVDNDDTELSALGQSTWGARGVPNFLCTWHVLRAMRKRLLPYAGESLLKAAHRKKQNEGSSRSSGREAQDQGPDLAGTADEAAAAIQADLRRADQGEDQGAGGGRRRRRQLGSESPDRESPEDIVNAVQNQWGGDRHPGDVPAVSGVTWLFERLQQLMRNAGREHEPVGTPAARWWSAGLAEVERRQRGRRDQDGGEWDSRVWADQSVCAAQQVLEEEEPAAEGLGLGLPAARAAEGVGERVGPGDLHPLTTTLLPADALTAAVARRIAVLETLDILTRLEDQHNLYSGHRIRGQPSSLRTWFEKELLPKADLWLLTKREELGHDVTTGTQSLERWHGILKACFLNALKARLQGRRIDWLVWVLLFLVLPHHERARRLAKQKRVRAWAYGTNEGGAGGSPGAPPQAGCTATEEEGLPVDAEGGWPTDGTGAGAGGDGRDLVSAFPAAAAVVAAVAKAALALGSKRKPVESPASGTSTPEDSSGDAGDVADLLPKLMEVAQTEVATQGWDLNHGTRMVFRAPPPAFPGAHGRDRVSSSILSPRRGEQRQGSRRGGGAAAGGEGTQLLQMLDQVGLSSEVGFKNMSAGGAGDPRDQEKARKILKQYGLHEGSKRSDVQRVRRGIRQGTRAKAMRSGRQPGRPKKGKESVGASLRALDLKAK